MCFWLLLVPRHSYGMRGLHVYATHICKFAQQHKSKLPQLSQKYLGAMPNVHLNGLLWASGEDGSQAAFPLDASRLGTWYFICRDRRQERDRSISFWRSMENSLLQPVREADGQRASQKQTLLFVRVNFKNLFYCDACASFWRHHAFWIDGAVACTHAGRLYGVWHHKPHHTI